MEVEMNFAQLRSAVAVVLILTITLIAHQPALGQSELTHFVASLDEARLADEILLVYFFSSELNHPTDLLKRVGSEKPESIGEQFSVLSIDISSTRGFEIADAFFGVGGLEPQDQAGPMVGVVRRDGRRGISMLSASADVVDPEDWLLFKKNISTN